MSYSLLDGNPDASDIAESIADYLSTCEKSEQHWFLYKCKRDHKMELMFQLMQELGYDKFVPKTLNDLIKLEAFEL